MIKAKNCNALSPVAGFCFKSMLISNKINKLNVSVIHHGIQIKFKKIPKKCVSILFTK